MPRALAFALLLLLVLSPAAHAAWPGDNGRIVWSSGGDLWSDGGRLTETAEQEAQATWSPDGRRLAFRTGSSPYRIAVMNADGSGRVTIGGSDRHETQPGWSPDGTRILYRRSVPGENLSGDIWSMRADGTDQQPLVVTPGADERYPAAAPQGDRVAYTSNRDGDYEVFVDDSAITSNAVFDSAPSWSPDGTRIAIERGSAGDAADNEIWTISSSGGDERRLTNDGSLDEGPAWSPDGAQIAFTSARDGDSEIWRMPAAGGEPVRVTDAPGVDESPDWQPVARAPAPTPPRCDCVPPPGPPNPPPQPPMPPCVCMPPRDADADADDDGLSDARERRIRTSPFRRDTDRDGLHDGLEVGVARPITGTDPRRFRRDRDPRTRTSPLRRDTDRDGMRDGAEDRNRNGRRDRGETDPRRPNGRRSSSASGRSAGPDRR